jgi:hypothetical protein
MIVEAMNRDMECRASSPTLRDLQKLASALQHDAELVFRLRDELNRIEASESYRSWQRTVEPTGAPWRAPRTDFDLVRKIGLLNGDDFVVKVNRHRAGVLLTDGLWAKGDVRVFPFVDESELLLRHAQTLDLLDWSDTLIDPATGAGSHVMGAGGAQQRWAYDINPRAIAMTQINGLLNRAPRLTAATNDIRAGLPEELAAALEGNALVLANMPFALSVGQAPKQLAADGGRTGADLTFATLQAVTRLCDKRRPGGGLQALLLCYSVGDRAQDRWEVADRAREMFGPRYVDWTLLNGERLWRVNGRKEQVNPMELRSGLRRKAQCRFTREDADQDALTLGYDRLAAELNEQGWDVLGYGVLQVRAA